MRDLDEERPRSADILPFPRPASGAAGPQHLRPGTRGPEPALPAWPMGAVLPAERPAAAEPGIIAPVLIGNGE